MASIAMMAPPILGTKRLAPLLTSHMTTTPSAPPERRVCPPWPKQRADTAAWCQCHVVVTGCEGGAAAEGTERLRITSIRPLTSPTATMGGDEASWGLTATALRCRVWLYLARTLWGAVGPKTRTELRSSVAKVTSLREGTCST